MKNFQRIKYFKGRALAPMENEEPTSNKKRTSTTAIRKRQGSVNQQDKLKLDYTVDEAWIEKKPKYLQIAAGVLSKTHLSGLDTTLNNKAVTGGIPTLKTNKRRKASKNSVIEQP